MIPLPTGEGGPKGRVRGTTVPPQGFIVGRMTISLMKLLAS
jgi:hypothetical protein